MAELRCDDGTVVPISKETEKELRKAFGGHEWVHGDVFETGIGTWIYLKPAGVPRVMCITAPSGDSDIGSAPDIHLRVATFLFNIKDKL